MIMTTKEALLEVGSAATINPDFVKIMIPTAIAVWRGKITAVEWFVEDYGHFWDDENIVSISTIINLK